MILYRSRINSKVRMLVGLILLAVLISTGYYFGIYEGSTKTIVTVTVITLISWFVSVIATDKYKNKNPNRYFTYSLAQSFKALIIVSLLIGFCFLFGIVKYPIILDVIWIMLSLSIIDLLLDFVVIKDTSANINKQMENFYSKLNYHNSDNKVEKIPDIAVNINELTAKYKDIFPDRVIDLLIKNIPCDDSKLSSLIVEKNCNINEQAEIYSFIMCGTSLNNVPRLNNLLKDTSQILKMGGYYIVNYTPMEFELVKLREKSNKISYPLKYISHFIIYRGLLKINWLSKLYFTKPFLWIDRLREKHTSGKRRSLARAEVWGRLVYYGMEIVEEILVENQAYLLVRRVSKPSDNNTPTYHAVVTIQKVGLGGTIVKLHKVRSMYPFSEFLQKDLYKMNGLTNTGKFKNDFRLTDYGSFIRKYWIDEIPGIFDWLKGDIKLVGMRATSPHYLNLYPREVIEKYIQVKPGLVPPIFDEKTAGLEQIIEVEDRYLTRYLSNPIKTDILYLWYTFRDIFIRKVRSK